MAKAPKKACKGCGYCIPYYGNFDKSRKRTVSKYFCAKRLTVCNFPKECEFRKEKNYEKV